ncbi:MAG TPA: hypothetical protein VGO64_09540 [Candidatus Limnocylindrales bacterium]|nr:hypothetical protein [Candidatus Limnocylindrales bacterium]
MVKRTSAATGAALLALLVVASPASADTEYAGNASSIDWRLVVILSVVALTAFVALLERATRGR